MKDWIKRNWKNTLLILLAVLFMAQCTQRGNWKREALSVHEYTDSVEVVLQDTRDTLKLTRDTLQNKTLYEESLNSDLQKSDSRESHYMSLLAEKDRQIQYWMKMYNDLKLKYDKAMQKIQDMLQQMAVRKDNEEGTL